MNRSLIVLIAVILGGCSTTPNYDAQFGAALRDAKLAMRVFPDGAPDATAAAGIDGTAAIEARARYHDSFKAPPPVVNVINIGGGIAGGGK